MIKKNDKVILSVSARDVKKNLTALKKIGYIPANIFGLKKDSEAISILKKDFHTVLKNSGESSVLFLQLDKKEEPVMIGSIDYHPVEKTMNHVSFRRVDLKQKIEKNVPILVVGEFSVPDATYLLVKDEIAVVALPEDFPDHFEVDVSTLTSPDSHITLSDLSFDKKSIELALGEDENPADIQLVVVQEIKEEVETAEENVEIESSEEPEPADTSEQNS